MTGRSHAISDAAHLEIRAGAVVAATGSYERVPLVPGADRPGVMGARTAAALVSAFGVLPGRGLCSSGTGDELVEAGRLLAASGASVVGPIATESLLSVAGDRRVTGAVTRNGLGRTRIAVDLVVFGDRTPNLDLVLGAGAAVTRQTGTLLPVTEACGRTSQPSLFVVGSAAGRPIRSAADAEAARATGRSAAGHAVGATSEVLSQAGDSASAADGPVSSSRPARIARNSMVCFCEDVRAFEIRSEQAARIRGPGADQAPDGRAYRSVSRQVLPPVLRLPRGRHGGGWRGDGRSCRTPHRAAAASAGPARRSRVGDGPNQTARADETPPSRPTRPRPTGSVAVRRCSIRATFQSRLMSSSSVPASQASASRGSSRRAASRTWSSSSAGTRAAEPRAEMWRVSGRCSSPRS